MQVSKTNKSDTEVLVKISATTEDLAPIKQTVLKKLAKNVKVSGYREGKVPAQVAEKHLDQQQFQTEFLDEAMTVLYAQATHQEKIRPVTQPKVEIKKFVPFTVLEYEVETSILGPVKLGKYKGLKLTEHKKEVTAKDVDGVIDTLATRMSEKSEVKRASKNGDEVILDFKGTDAKKQPIPGSDGTDYPLMLGSNTFIPGFEDNVIGLKPGDKKTFTITFPKNYGAKNLAGTKVTFDIEVKKVNELKKPEINDEFATQVGPFTAVSELKEDIKKQLEQEAATHSLREMQNEAVEMIADNSEVSLPKAVIDQQATYELDEVRRTLTGRGMTYQEFIEAEGTTEEKYLKDAIEPRAERQVKIGILISEIAEAEKIEVSEEELEMQMQMLRQQYKDPQMQEQLGNPEARRDIASRILSQKVVNWIIDQSEK